MLNGYTLKCSGSYWSNLPFLSFFDIRALNVKNQKGGLDQYDAERFGRLIFATIRKSVGLKGLTSEHTTGHCGVHLPSQSLVFPTNCMAGVSKPNLTATKLQYKT